MHKKKNLTLKKLILILVFISATNIVAFSQNRDTVTFYGNKFFCGASYYGNNIIKPGLKFNVNYILNGKLLTKYKTGKSGKSKNKSAIKQMLLTGDIGFLWFPQSHFAVFNYYQIVFKKIKLKNSLFSSIAIGPGIYRTIYPEAYEVDITGEVKPVNGAGNTYFSSVITLGNGKIIDKKLFGAWFINVDFMFLFNYNTGIVPLLNVGFGFNFK